MKWSKKQGVKQWLLRYSWVLYVLSFCCGNSFAALGMVNSHAFRLKIFSMGLSQRDLNKFNLQSLISVVICETIPQLVVQIWYVIQAEDLNDEDVAIGIAAAAFSGLQII